MEMCKCIFYIIFYRHLNKQSWYFGVKNTFFCVLCHDVNLRRSIKLGPNCSCWGTKKGISIKIVESEMQKHVTGKPQQTKPWLWVMVDKNAFNQPLMQTASLYAKLVHNAESAVRWGTVATTNCYAFIFRKWNKLNGCRAGSRRHNAMCTSSRVILEWNV